MSCRTIKAIAVAVMVLHFAFSAWVTVLAIEKIKVFLVLAWVVLPNLLLLIAMSRLKTVPLCGWAAAVCIITNLAACYVYFDGFFIHVSSLNNVLLLQIPLVQLVIALVLLVLVLSQTRKRTP